VYNWQFMHSLSLWTRVIGELMAPTDMLYLLLSCLRRLTDEMYFVQETTQTVYNWQFVHSLSLWTQLIGELMATTDVLYLLLSCLKRLTDEMYFVQETTQTVYNWQFMHSLSLWTRLIGALQDDESIQSLIYPLTQTIIGTIKSVAAHFCLCYHHSHKHCFLAYD